MSRQEIMAELREWKQLLDDGLVTEEEFNTHRQQLMTQLKQHSASSVPGVGDNKPRPATPSGVDFFGTGGNTPPAFAPQAASGASFFGTGGSTPGPAVASGASFFGTGGLVPEDNTQGQVGQVLAGRYRLDALLGVGGMGEVYKATDTLSNTVCALKWIRPELADNEQLRQRFVNELQVTQRLSHPGIVRTYALAQDREQGALFFTMEYVEGDSLEDLLNHAEAEGRVPPVPVEKALEWLKTLAEALAIAHEEGILHRDLKPANIMVDQRGRLRLMDFGIAKAVGQATQLHTGYVGTPVYMPPEQLRGGKATPASDLYSFGVVAYQLLTGDLPQGRFEEPSKLLPELPGWVDRVVMKCLASRAENRYQRVSELLADWGEMEKTTPTTRRGERPERAQATSSRRQRKSAFKPKSALVAGSSRRIEVLPEATEIYCPPGSFRMGASPGDDEASGDGNPAREVTLTKGLWALSTPVTQAMYKAVMGENPSAFKTVEKEETYEVTEGAWLFKQTVERTRKIEVENWKAPVENVSWYDAVEFCNRLSKKAGLSPAYRIVKSSEKWDEKGEVEWLQESEGYRLPTEAEWENLCRAGTTGSRYGELEEVAWYSGNSDKQTHPVGQKAPNAWGFYDTLGNVWEWCMDESDAEAYSKLPQVNPAHVPHTVDERVGRGGSWDDDAWYARASYRDWDYATYRSNNLGFRVLRTPRVKAKP